MGIMGHDTLLQLILLFGILAGATATPSWEEPQEREHQSAMAELPPDQAFIKEADNNYYPVLEPALSVRGDVIRLANGTEVQLFPSSTESSGTHIVESAEHTSLSISLRRRRLGVFRQCSPCTCCDKTRRWCLPTVCCYNIRCGLQGLPYGLCSFIPISCTCFGCRK